jgi:hypothetical protein
VHEIGLSLPLSRRALEVGEEEGDPARRHRAVVRPVGAGPLTVCRSVRG